MDISHHLKTYTGSYGHPDSDTLVYNKITVPQGPKPNPKDREIILVVDLSGSMSQAVPHLQASLKAFQNSLAELSGSEGPSGVNVRMIGYNDIAWEIYSPESEVSFSEATDEIYARGNTNMGAGIKLAFDKTNPKKATWIVVLSDGKSNKGDYQTAESFSQLVKTAPKYTRIASIGYGDNFDANIMEAVGDFTYIKNPEMIPYFFGNLANEVLSTIAFGTTISSSFKSRIVIGSFNLGCLYPGAERVFGVVPYSDLTSDSRLTASFYIIGSPMKLGSISLEVDPVGTEEAPEQVKKEYYQFAAMRRLQLLYSSIGSGYLQNIMAKIKWELKKWTQPWAQESKAEVLNFIEKLEAGMNQKTIGYQLLGASSDTKRQYKTLAATAIAKKTATTYLGFSG